MKRFGVFDIILAVLIAAGIAANVFVYGFYDKDGSDGMPSVSGSPAPTAADNTPAQSVTERPANTSSPASVPQEPVVNTFVFRINSPNVTVNGRAAAIDEMGSAPYSQDGVSMLPLRATYETLGGSVAYDADTQVITAAFRDTSLNVKTGETGAEINGTPVTLASAPAAINGTTYVPTRAIADALGAELFWDGETQSITLVIPSESVIDASSLLPAVSQTSTDHTPSGDPTAADFAWYTDGGREMGMPLDAVPITETDMQEIMGAWKMFVWIDPDHIAYSDSSYILAKVSIDEIGGSVTMAVQELQMVDEDGTVQDLSGFGPERYTGGYLMNRKGIYAGESWHRYYVTDFYAAGGKQYGIGTLEVQSGEPCYVALVRP